VLQDLFDIPTRRFSELPLVFPIELAGIIMPHGKGGCFGAFAFHQQEALGFVEPQPLPEDYGRQGGDLPRLVEQIGHPQKSAEQILYVTFATLTTLPRAPQDGAGGSNRNAGPFP
jgi:hypothetical protein